MANILAGIAWPFRIADNGLPGYAKGTNVIRSALILLLRTPARSRVMRPDLGTNLQRLVFETEGPFLQALVHREILIAINNYLPMVKVIDIFFKETGSTIQVNIRYDIQGILDETDFFNVAEIATAA